MRSHPNLRRLAFVAIAFLITSGAASAQSVLINIDYKDFQSIWLSDLSADTRAKLKLKDGLLTLPTIETRNDTSATIEFVRQVAFLLGDKPKFVDCGVILKLHTIIKDGTIQVAGSSVLRRSNQQDAHQPALNPTFHMQETFINGTYESGKLIKIPVDPRDPAGEQLLLTFTLLKGDGKPAK